MCWKDTDNTEKGGEGRRRYSDNTTNSMYPFLIHSFIHSLTFITPNEILQGAENRYTRTERVR